MEGGLLLDVVIRQSATILKLLACEDETLLIRRDAKGKISLSPSGMDDGACLPFLVLNLCLDIINGIRGLDLQSNGLSG